MSQYFNARTGHLATDCVGCGRLVEVMQAKWGDQQVCTFCGLRYEVIPVIYTYRNPYSAAREVKSGEELRLEPIKLSPLENG